MENAKKIILNNKDNQSFKAILNLSEKFGSIKFYNYLFQSKNFALGIKQGDNVLKVPLEVKNNNSTFNFPQDINLKKDIVCAVVDVTNAFCPEIVLSGSLNSITENNKIENSFVVKKPEDTSELYLEETDEEIEKLVETNIQDDLNSTYYDNCASCKYRKAFYDEGGKIDYHCSFNTRACSNETRSDLKEEITEDKKTENIEKISNKINGCNNIDNKVTESDNNEEKSFYMQVKPQIDVLFDRYEREEILQSIIPNSTWAKVKYDGGEEYYVLGLIYDDTNKNVDYICYGVPSIDSKNPPEDIKDYAQWLPLDINNPQNGGYWIVYQNGLNGQTVAVNFI